MKPATPTHPALKPLDRLVGTWVTDITHPAAPGVLVHGDAVVEWLEGGQFLIHRARCDHPDFPDSISIIGFTDVDRADDGAPASGEHPLRMQYFDSRGVSRVFDVEVDDTSWRWQRLSPGFSQRFTGTFADGGDTVVGVSQLSRDDRTWNDDLRITYRRR